MNTTKKETINLEKGQYFHVEPADSIDMCIFHFPEVPTTNIGEIPLRAVVRNVTGLKLMAHIQAKFLNYSLGKLRWLYEILNKYNEGIDSDDVYYTRYIRYQVLNTISGFGYQAPNSSTKLTVPGLDKLITEIETLYKDQLEYHKLVIKDGCIVFEALQELFRPGIIVRGMTSLGVPGGFSVVQSYYQERRTLFGFETSFHLQLQFIATLGADFAVIEFEHIMSRWMGESLRKTNELYFQPADNDQITKFLSSGEKYVSLGIGAPKFLHHDSGCVFLHSISTNNTALSRSNSAVLTGTGRILIDTVKGAELGHHASRGQDDASQALIELTGRYRRFITEQKSVGQKITNPDTIFLISEIPNQLKAITWPALVGFSFVAKSWCHVLVGGLKEIVFNDKAFDELVLDNSRKRLIRALVRFGGEQFEDIIQGKSGGSIFLLHGPPGIGK